MMPDFNSTLKQPSCPNAIVQHRPGLTFTPQKIYFSTRTNFLLSHAYGPEEEDAMSLLEMHNLLPTNDND